MPDHHFLRRVLAPAALTVAALMISPSFWPRAAVLASQAAAAAGTLSFTDITAAAGLASRTTGSHGAFWADATGDGLPDLFLTYNDCRSGERTNRFYRNAGNGAFVEETSARGLDRMSGGSHGGTFADVDNDGDYDLIVANTYGTDCVTTEAPPALANQVYRNDGRGFFVDRTPPAMAAYLDYTRGALAFDMDKDGDLDIFAVNGDMGSWDPIDDRNELYRNDGGFTFTAITTGALITTPAGQAGAATDYDFDGDMDIFLPDFGRFSLVAGNLGVLRNDGNGTFTSVDRTSIGITERASTGVTSGDLNGDALLDLVLIDQDRDPLRRLGWDRVAYVFLNRGGGQFTKVFEVPSGYFGGFSAGLADLDNDGDLDMVLPGLPYVLLNDGAAHFSVGPFWPSPEPEPGCIGSECTKPDMRSLSFADTDGDGDLDFVVTTKFEVFHMIRNNFNSGNWLKVGLLAANGQAGAFGAKVGVLQAGTTSLIAMREARGAYGYLSQDDPVLHFGLGAATTVDVIVQFLNGTTTTVRGVSANQTIFFNGTSLVQAPNAPQNLTSSVSGNNVTLTWQAPTTGSAASSYVVEAGSTSGANDLATLPVGSATSLNVSAPNGVYYVRVRGRNIAGSGVASNETIVDVGNCRPNAPTSLAFTKSGSLVTLTWTAPSGGPAVAGYRLEVGSTSGAANLLVYDAPSITAISASAPPGRYYVRVKARTSCGIGTASNEIVVDIP